jgi:hypothetical protein
LPHVGRTARWPARNDWRRRSRVLALPAGIVPPRRYGYFVILVWAVAVLLLLRGWGVTLVIFAVSVITGWLAVAVRSSARLGDR